MNKKEEYFKKCIEPYSAALEEYAAAIGLKSRSREFLLSEAYSRKAGEEVLWDIDLRVETIQEPLNYRYDIVNCSGDTEIPVEVKCRNCSIDKYPTTDISAAKGDYVTSVGGWLIIFFNEGFDYLVFDLSRYKSEMIKEWTHSETTAEETDKMKTEDRFCFNPEKAIYRGKLPDNWINKGGYGRHS